MNIKYEPHPVAPERKAELIAQGYQIVDAIYAPKDHKPDQKEEQVKAPKKGK